MIASSQRIALLLSEHPNVLVLYDEMRCESLLLPWAAAEIEEEEEAAEIGLHFSFNV